MTSQKIALPSGAEDSNLPAQRRPDEASERPLWGGISPKGRWSRRGATRGRRGRASPLGSYRLIDTPDENGKIKVPSLLQVKRHSKLNRYFPLCWQFIEYLRHKEKIQFIIEGYDSRIDNLVTYVLPYIHRWKPEYMKARLAKFYKLDEWAKTNPLPLSLLTFTTYHNSAYARRKRGKGFTIDESWDILKNGYWKASMLIRNKIRKGVPYFWIAEPQPESGYPHIHAGYFTEFTNPEKDRLKNHWSRVIEAGDYKHGLDFSFEQMHQSGEVKSLRNYLMKYLAKTFVETIPNWTPEELVFNAIAWKQGYRFFGCSRDLSHAMKRPVIDDPCYTWLTTSVRNPELGIGEDILIRQNPTLKSGGIDYD
ncbi:MAG: hypothetical protein ABSE72_11720 [Bacteroidales bacterium]